MNFSDRREILADSTLIASSLCKVGRSEVAASRGKSVSPFFPPSFLPILVILGKA